MYLLNRTQPKIKKKDVYPANYTIKLVFQDISSKLKIHKMAKAIVNHMNTVEESRKLYKEGKFITWDTFINNENASK